MASVGEALNHLQQERDRLQAEADRMAAELRRINKAIAALADGTDRPAAGTGKRGRPPGSKLSAEARAKIAAAQRARWAKAKKEK